MTVRYKIFQSGWESWTKLFDQAAEFAGSVGPGRLIGISQSEGPGSNGVVTVWYWDKAVLDDEYPS